MKNHLKSAGKLYADVMEQEEEIIELADVVSDPGGLQEEIIELTDIVAESPAPADGKGQTIVELTEEIFPIDNSKESDPVIELSEIASFSETADRTAVEQGKFYESIEEDGVISLVDPISSQLDPGADIDDLPIETLDDAHVVELIDLNEAFDSADPEAIPFAIPLDESEFLPDAADEAFALDDEALKAGMGSPAELDFESMDELADELGKDLDSRRASEVAEQLGMEMQAAKADQAEGAVTDDDFSLSLESIRSKLDSVFPDEETTDLPDAIGLAETPAQAPSVVDEADLTEPLFPEPAPEAPPAEASWPEAAAPFAEAQTEAQISSSIFETAEPPADIPEFQFPEAEFDPEMAPSASQDLEPDMPESMLPEAEPTPALPELMPAVANRPESAIARTAGEPGVQLEAMVVSSVVRALGAPTDQQIEAALARVIKTMYGDKIEQLLIEVIERTVSNEIRKIKNALLDEADRLT